MCQRRWIEAIKDYDFYIVYQHEKAKNVFDALSRRSRVSRNAIMSIIILRSAEFGIRAL